MIPLLVIGSGGHASEVIESARLSDRYEPVAVLDDNEELWGTEFYGLTIVGGISEELLSDQAAEVAIMAIGSNRVRSEIATRFEGLVGWATLIHPTAYISPAASISEGAVIGVNAVIQPGCRVGRHTIVNTAAIVGHDTLADDFSQIGPGTIMAGGSKAGVGAFLATGVKAIPNVSVGDWSTVGAGGVVVRDIPSGVTAVGIPAKVIK